MSWVEIHMWTGLILVVVSSVCALVCVIVSAVKKMRPDFVRKYPPGPEGIAGSEADNSDNDRQ